MLVRVKPRLRLIPVRLGIMLAYAPSKIHVSDVHEQMLRTSSKLGKDEPRQQITLGVHVEKRRRNENAAHAPSEQNQKCIASQ